MNRKTSQRLLLLFTFLAVLAISVITVPPEVYAVCFDAVRLREVIPNDDYIAMYVGGRYRMNFSTQPEQPIIESVRLAVDGDAAFVSGSDIIAVKEGTGVARLSVDAFEKEIPVRVIKKPVPPDSDLPPLYDDELLAVNVNSRITGEYRPETVDFPPYIHKNRPSIQMEAVPMQHFLDMYHDVLELCGQELWVISAYRTYDYQEYLFERSVSQFMAQGYGREEAERLAGQTTQPPGCSEHQLGNSMDLGTSAELTYAFNDTEAGKYVTAHAHEYGFILRYPADKTEQTGIDYESWHFRYVGVEHATYIYEHSLCLEEYIELQKKARAAAEEYAEKVSAKEYLSLIGEL